MCFPKAPKPDPIVKQQQRRSGRSWTGWRGEEEGRGDQALDPRRGVRSLLAGTAAPASAPTTPHDLPDQRVRAARLRARPQLRSGGGALRPGHALRHAGPRRVLLDRIADDEIDDIFDETAIVATQEFASRLQAGIIPNFTRWAKLKAGLDIDALDADQVNQDLEAVTEFAST